MTKRPSSSKLAPYTATLFRWKEEGRSYREMAALLMKEHGLDAHPDSIHSFMNPRNGGGPRDAGQEAGASAGGAPGAPQPTGESSVASLLKAQQEQLSELKEMLERIGQGSAGDRQEDRRGIEAMGLELRTMGAQVQAVGQGMQRMSEDRRAMAEDLDRATKRGWIWLGMGAVVFFGVAGSINPWVGLVVAAGIVIAMGWWTWTDWTRRKRRAAPAIHEPMKNG